MVHTQPLVGKNAENRIIPVKVWVFALILAILTSLPYVFSLLNTPDGWVYSGAPGVPSGTEVDYNSHMAKMWQGSRGQWDYRLLFTHEDHAGIPFVQGFYVALGTLATIMPLSLPAVYHVARFVLTAGMVMALWLFATYYFEQRRECWLVIFFGTLVSGWSWLLLLIDPAQTTAISPIEFWLLDAFNLLGALSMPHFAAAVILQIVVILAYERWCHWGDWRNLLIIAFALVLESFIQPYVIALFGPLLVMFAVYRVFISRQMPLVRALWLIPPLGLHILLVIYQFIAINSDPVWASFTAQNLTMSPPVIYYLLGYLPLLLPAILGLPHLVRRGDRWWLLIVWVVLVAMLVYAPLPTQRRYLLGVQTPLALLAVVGWTQSVEPRIGRGYRAILTGAYIVLASLAMVAILAANISAGLHTSPVTHYTPDEWQAIVWLRENRASPDDLVLTTFDRTGRGSGGRVVAALGQRVYAGHWIETAFLDDKVAQLQRFYDSATSNNWRQQFLNAVGAVYLWYDERARAIGDWNPDEAAYLDPVFESDSVTIYALRN